jgi:death on curing protein
LVAIRRNRRDQHAVAKTKEPFYIRELGALEGAWARPINYWSHGERDISILAAVLMLGIAQSHPFLQGNKRTGFTAAGLFLQSNGYDITCPPDRATGKFIRRAVIGLFITYDDLIRVAQESVVWTGS